jgi:Na+/melibiose symporter-like transporter
VLPALLVLGMGMVLLVAPLTATVLASAETGRAGLASGVNNAVARAASLIAVAALPLLAGMGPQAYRDAGEFGAAFRRAMSMCAVLLVIAALLAWVTIRADALVPAPEGERRPCRPECRTYCAVAAPPLDPGDPRSASGPDGRRGGPDPGGPAPGSGVSGPES